MVVLEKRNSLVTSYYERVRVGYERVWGVYERVGSPKIKVRFQLKPNLVSLQKASKAPPFEKKVGL